MGLPGKCWYPMQAFRSGGPQALAAMLEDFFRSGWDPIVLGGIDGSNAHPNLAGGGLSWSGSSGSGGGAPYPPKPSPPPHLPAPWAKRLVVEMADETADAHIRKKGAPGTPENRKPGVEIVIDPSDTTYGKVCFVAKQDKSKQIGSVIVENPVTVTNPKVDFFANYGKMRFGTSGAFDWEIVRNGTVTLDDDGSRIKAGRASLYLGGDDLAVERSAAGKMLLRDPSGGVTDPGIQFGSSAVELKLSGADLSAVLGSGQAFALSGGRIAMTNAGGTPGLHLGSSDAIHFGSTAVWSSTRDAGISRAAAGVTKSTDGSAGFGDHALKHLLGYGAATGFRTKIDFGTPTADRTLTAPNRDLTLVGRAAAGTSNKLIRFDANGDAQDAGASDDGSTITVDRATIAGAAALTVRGVNVDNGSNGGAATVNGGDVADGNGGDTGGAALVRGGNAGADGDGGALSVRGGDASGVGTGGAVTHRAGSSGSGTNGVWDLQTAGGASRIKVNADGTVTQAGDHTFSGTVSFGKATATASSGGTYQVPATVTEVHVDMSALTGSQDYVIEPPNAATYPGRLLIIQITVLPGTPSAQTLTINPASGNINGAASKALDGTGYTQRILTNNGTDWFCAA